MAKRKRAVVPTYAGFRKFLQKEGCKVAFDANFDRQYPGYVLDERLWSILGCDECLFGKVFPWNGSPEGEEFWSRIDKKWFAVCMDAQKQLMDLN